MSVLFLEPGGDTTFGLGLLGTNGGTPAVATDFVHGGHQRSIKFRPNTLDQVAPLKNGSSNVVKGESGRISIYHYFNVMTNASAAVTNIIKINDNGGNNVFRLQITNGGVLQLFETTNQIGSNGATLSTGNWYRIAIAWSITSTSVNEFRVFKDGVQTISVTNATLTRTATSGNFNSSLLGNIDGDSDLDFRISDIYIDDSSALTDSGNIWVTAKRPNANGTINNFNVQIGAGGSGYGSGYSPQVNERPSSDTNGWSVVAVAATTEEYNIEGKATGDINISTATIVDYMGWVRASSVTSETAQILVSNVTSNISLTSSVATFTAMAGSAIYPAGTGTDIGIVSSATATTVGLYEAGIVVAYIPASSPLQIVLKRNF